MEVFPTDPAPVYPLVVTPVWNTSISKNGTQRRGRWLYAKYNVKVNYTNPTLADAKTLWSFYMARKGALEGFYIYDLYAFDHEAMYVGTGDGTTDTFDIPGQSTSAQTLYIDGSEFTSGFSYLVGGGDGSSDRVEFTTAPASGETITIDFTGYLRIKCRFSDKMSRENFTTTMMRYGIELTGI